MRDWPARRKRVTHRMVGVLILLNFLILSGCSNSAFQTGPTHLSPSLAPTIQEPSATPISPQRLRIVNQSSFTIQHLQVRFPDEAVDFGDVLPGTSTDYQTVSRGVYRYAAYDVMVEGQEYQQPVIDWVGENPLKGSTFTYFLDVDPARWKTEGQVILLVKTTEDSATASLISQQTAVDAALKIASSSMPEISGALVTPQNVQAEQITLGDALRRLHGSATSMNGYPADMAVWFVTMEGLWASEASAPEVTPSVTQQPYHFCTIILDASTGLEIEGSLRP